MFYTRLWLQMSYDDECPCDDECPYNDKLVSAQLLNCSNVSNDTLAFCFLFHVHPSLIILSNCCSARSPLTQLHSPTMMADLAVSSESWFRSFDIVPPENENTHSGSTDVAMT